MGKKKRRHGHFCRICKCYLPDEWFSGQGRRIHVCTQCARLPKAERFRIESLDRCWDFLFHQSHISARNIALLAELAKVQDQEVSRFAAVVLELARLRPCRRHRFRGLHARHPELWQRMIELGIVMDFGFAGIDRENEADEDYPLESREPASGTEPDDQVCHDHVDHDDIPF